MLIGVVGTIASGKSILSDILVEKGFIKLSFSAEVREEAKLRNIPIERTHLQDLGNEMRKKEGGDYWARRIISKIGPGNNYVIEGIRNTSEVKALEKLDNFTLIAVDAPIEKRFQWIMLRGKDSDPSSLSGVKSIDARDRGIGEDEHGQQTSACVEMAKIKIVNDSTKEKLAKKIEKLLKSLKL
jgi:dephospho-CoA kinase